MMSIAPSSAHTSPTLAHKSTLSRHGRQHSNTTLASLFEEPWDKPCVLSLDGGGIRGYSSLIILRELMKEVYAIETQDFSEPAKAEHSSYEPEHYVPCIRNNQGTSSNTEGFEGSSGCDECCRYIPAHYFDYIGGTSTGGLISIMLGRLRMSVKHCMEEYEILSGNIFGHPRWASVRGPLPALRDKYNGERIQKAVEDVINRRMSEEERMAGAGSFNSPRGLCRTVVFAYASKISNNVSDYGSGPEGQQTVDSEEAAPYIFRSYDRWASNPPGIFERNPGYAHNVAIWEAARATTAAPLYFDPIKIGNRKFGDGGFGSNNPAEEMATEVACMNGYDFNDCMELLLSIGTGDMPPISRIAKEDAPLKKYATYFNAAKKLASDARDVHERLEVRRQFHELPYYRFNVPKNRGLDKIKLDEWRGPKWYCLSRRRTLDKIRDATETYCNEKGTRDRLKDVAKVLVARRNARKTHDLWPLVSRGEQYRCTFKDCKMCQRVLPRKDDLVCHLRTRHGVKEDKMEEWLRKGLCPPKSVSNGAITTNGGSVANSV